MKASIQVNETKPMVFFVANIPIFLATFAINVWASNCILQRERTGLNRLVVCDCVLNVVSSLHSAFLQSPWSLLASSTPCLISTFLLYLLVCWNRLVPVAIAVFRYVMVCHPVFVQNHGGEKMVWQLLFIRV